MHLKWYVDLNFLLLFHCQLTRIKMSLILFADNTHGLRVVPQFLDLDHQNDGLPRVIADKSLFAITLNTLCDPYRNKSNVLGNSAHSTQLTVHMLIRGNSAIHSI